MIKPFDRCPVCGGELAQKEVEKLLKGGGNTAVVRVKAEICLHCGERLYAKETIRRFDDIRNKLRDRQTEGFRPLGQSFEVVK